MKALRRSQSTSSSSVANLSPPIPLVRLSSPWVPLRELLVVSSSSRCSDGGNIRSSWSRRKRKHALSRHQWIRLFTPDRRFRDGGVKFLKKVRHGGVDPEIRTEVWPFLLGVYDLNSSAAERNVIRKKKRKEYLKLRLLCFQLFKYGGDSFRNIDEASDGNDESPNFIDGDVSPFIQDAYSIRNSLSYEESQHGSLIHSSISASYTNRYVMEESDGESSEEPYDLQFSSISADNNEDNELLYSRRDLLEGYSSRPCWTEQDFATWRRIIRLDALRADAECMTKQTEVSIVEAYERAHAAELKDYEHLEPRRIHHAARLVEILEAYAFYDPEIGYCQGMSDLLSPIIAVIKEDHEAFWCFVGFMRKARQNFRLDETGISRQLNFVSKIIKSRDLHLYRHLEKLKAEDCSFVYRMVVVLFRRELSFEQTLCLWEAMWADQAAIRAGLERFTCGRIRLKARPTNDLLLYAIAACILQRGKLIIKKYSSMDEIVKECNNLTGHLNVWKLLDDAHNLVASLHNKM